MAGFRVEHLQVNINTGFGAFTTIFQVPERHRYTLRRIDLQNNDGGNRSYAVIRSDSGGGQTWFNSLKIISGNTTFRFVGHWAFSSGDLFVVQNWSANTNPPFIAVQFAVEKLDEVKEE